LAPHVFSLTPSSPPSHPRLLVFGGGSAARDGQLALFDTSTGARSACAPPHAHGAGPTALALPAVGGGARAVVTTGGGAAANVAASGGEDGLVRLWGCDAATRDSASGIPVAAGMMEPPRLLHTLRGHTGAVHCVAVSAPSEGDFVVSGSADASIRVWSAASGRCLENVSAKGRPVLSLSLVGRLLASAGRDGVITVWDLQRSSADSSGAQLRVVTQLAAVRHTPRTCPPPSHPHPLLASAHQTGSLLPATPLPPHHTPFPSPPPAPHALRLSSHPPHLPHISSHPVF